MRPCMRALEKQCADWTWASVCGSFRGTPLWFEVDLLLTFVPKTQTSCFLGPLPGRVRPKEGRACRCPHHKKEAPRGSLIFPLHGVLTWVESIPPPPGPLSAFMLPRLGMNLPSWGTKKAEKDGCIFHWTSGSTLGTRALSLNLQ